MTAPASQIQWYLAREGQQYGPLSEAELAKFVELGHLQPNDLLWREGFPDWRPAMVVFPQRPAASTQRAGPTAPPGRRPPPDYGSPSTFAREPEATRPGGDHAAGAAARLRPTRPAPDDEHDDRPQPRSVGGTLRKLVVAAILVGALGTAAWIAYPHRAQLMNFMTSLPSLAPGADRKSLATPPFAGLKGNAQAIDAAMQSAALWRVIKREFPDWYAQRLTEIETLASRGGDDAAIGQHLARALIALRRQQVDNALSAQMPRLKIVATAFLDNIAQLRKSGTEACYAFISQGESNPIILGLLQRPEHTVHLQGQMVAIFEAIADGRKSPRVYPAPRQSDYDALAADLTKLGWTKADLQLFSDERALARAGPEKVCQLVHDWFAAQLAITDTDVQQRLLVDSLRPVVAG